MPDDAAASCSSRDEHDLPAEKDAGCGGCRGIGSHRRHCPRHPDYHPWKRLADMAESIGDGVGEPGLANQAWALAGAIRDAIPDHPYRRPIPPADPRDPAPCPRCGEVCKYDGWGLVHASGIGIGSCPIPPGDEDDCTCGHDHGVSTATCDRCYWCNPIRHEDGGITYPPGRASK